MYDDHLFAHGLLFNKYKIKSLIEFGLGEGTKFFLDRMERVVSVELYTKDHALADQLKISNNHWMNMLSQKFSSYENWEIIPYECGEDILRAEHNVTGHGSVKRGDNPPDDEYKKEIKALIDKLFLKQYDYAFVDAGVHLRGDIVNELFGRVKIIGAHDTNTKSIYGYNRVVCPDDYKVEQGKKCGEGITFWICKS